MFTSENFEEYQSKVLELGRSNIIRHTIQILLRNDKGQIRPCGTGVTFKIDEHYFILTAAHVVNEFPDGTEIHVNIQDGYPVIECEVRSTDLEFHSTVDLAYLHLEPESAELLKKYYQFIEMSKLYKDHEIHESFSYLISGYPIENYKFEKDGWMVTGASLLLLRGCPKDQYAKHGYTEDMHHCFVYEHISRDMISGESKLTDDPQGISGSGVYFMFMNEGTLEYRLVGIVIELQLNPPMMIVSNRIEPLMQQLFEDLNLPHE